MFKLVKSMAIFLMLIGMFTTAFAEIDSNKNKIISDKGKAELIESIDERNEGVKLQTLSMKNREMEKVATPICLETSVEEEPIFEESIPVENILEESTSEESVSVENILEKVTSEESVPVENILEKTNSEEIVPEVINEEVIETEPQYFDEVWTPNDYHTGVLTARKGYITDSPCGPNGNDGWETWYPTNPGGAVKILEKQCGFTNLKMEVCKEEGPRYGVRIISGTMPSGETFENLVVVAADIVCESNPSGAFERGQLIETSLGPGIIVDYCERAVEERKYNGRTHIDIATDWYN